jgi:hypothetical protein
MRKENRIVVNFLNSILAEICETKAKVMLADKKDLNKLLKSMFEKFDEDELEKQWDKVQRFLEKLEDKDKS